MKRPLGHVPAIICASALLMAHICLGQTTAQPPATAPAPQTGPVVVGEKPAADPAQKADTGKKVDPASGKPATGDKNQAVPVAVPATTPVMDLTFHPDPKDIVAPANAASPNAASPNKDPDSRSTDSGIIDAKNPSLDPSKAPSSKDASSAYATGTQPYVIGSLDVVEIQVWNSPNLSGIRDVGSDGMITLPLVGEIRADGLTKKELTQLLKEKLASTVFTEAPEVTVQVVRVNSKKYFVFGGVNRSGEFPLVGQMTVMDAFANCGGFHDFAKTNKIYILRGTQRLKFNFKEVSQGKKMEQDIKLQSGDRIFVPE